MALWFFFCAWMASRTPPRAEPHHGEVDKESVDSIMIWEVQDIIMDVKEKNTFCPDYAISPYYLGKNDSYAHQFR